MNSRVVQIHGAREDTDRESMVKTFGYDTMKRLNKYWYEDSEDKVRLSDLEDKSVDTPAKNIETTITMLKGIVPYAVIIDLSRSIVIMPVIRPSCPLLSCILLIGTAVNG
ncbi:MAG: YcaO-like family protein [Methanosarcinales archaeon]|nr:YcaO-like family protein [Methanosarcinales archaeon]